MAGINLDARRPAYDSRLSIATATLIAAALMTGCASRVVDQASKVSATSPSSAVSQENPGDPGQGQNCMQSGCADGEVSIDALGTEEPPKNVDEARLVRDETSSVTVQRQALRSLLAAQNVRPLAPEDFPTADPAKVALGRFLFFDRLLSGNKQVACATCHAQRRATTDQLSLVISQGQRGLIKRFLLPSLDLTLPRNATDLFNRGHRSIHAMFLDSRVRADPMQPSGFATPAGAELPVGLDSVLAAQAMFPVLQADEMLGKPGENELADLKTKREIWQALTRRLLAVSEYRQLLMQAYPGVALTDFGFQHAANAIAAFTAYFWRADNSPFDQFLRGDDAALSQEQVAGSTLFYGRAGCGGCHTGSLLTDQRHYAVAIPQFGPGKGDGRGGLEDFGFGRVTNRREDRYRFRTPSLRNVALTGPWGHNGAYSSLEAVVRHFSDPVRGLATWDPAQVQVVSRRYPDGFFAAYFDPVIRDHLMAANEAPAVELSDAEINQIVAFLHSLTDVGFMARGREIPLKLPSGQRDVISLLPDIVYTAEQGLVVGPLLPFFASMSADR